MAPNELTHTDTKKWCSDDCEHDGIYDGNPMERCYQCFNWFHVDCISKTEELITGSVWTCFQCRNMPSVVRDMYASIQGLHGLIKTLTETVSDMKNTQDGLVSNLNEERLLREKLQLDNEELRSNRASSIAQSSSAVSRTLSHGTLLLGSSIVRDIDERKLTATKRMCISGGRLKDMQDALDTESNTVKYERIILVTGGNDCDDFKQEAADACAILATYKDLISSAKLLADHVTVSSICPRKRSDAVTERIATVNAGLQIICDDMDVTFAQNDDMFYLRDGTLNDGFLLPDNVHLTPAATNRLVRKLGLVLRQGCENAHCDHRRRDPKRKDTPAQTNKRIDDGNNDLSNPFWATAWKKVEPPRNNRNKRNTTTPGSSPQTQRPPTGLPRNAGTGPRTTPHTYAEASKGMFPGARAPTNPRGSPPRFPPSRGASTSFPAPTQHASRPREQSLACQLCLGAGHSAVTCHARNTTCFKCGTVGHLSRACPANA